MGVPWACVSTGEMHVMLETIRYDFNGCGLAARRSARPRGRRSGAHLLKEDAKPMGDEVG